MTWPERSKVGLILWWRYFWRASLAGMPMLWSFSIFRQAQAQAGALQVAVGIVMLTALYVALCAWILSRWFLPRSGQVAGVQLMAGRAMPLPYAAGWRLLWSILWRSTLISVAGQVILFGIAKTGL
ncbi:MAG: hypothetical protein U7M05_12570, partial [Candidatus Igneacidithiobacillus chanchocoensis]